MILVGDLGGTKIPNLVNVATLHFLHYVIPNTWASLSAGSVRNLIAALSMKSK